MGLQPIILLPLFISLYVLIRHSVEKAFLNVYLPVLLLLPLYDQLKLPGLPFLTFGDTAIFPIGIWLFATRWRQWRFSRMDVWMLLFGVSCTAALYIRNDTLTPPINGLFGWLTTALFPYAIGRLLIEQNKLRLATLKRFVILLAVVGILSLYEYRMAQNPFHNFWNRVFPPAGRLTLMNLDRFEQFRWGFTRAAGPYFGSEVTGMVFIIGTLFAYYLYKNDLWERKFRWKGHPYKKGTLLLIALSIGMFTNQARGPYLGFLVGIIAARVGTARNIKRAAKLTVLLFVLVGIPGYEAMSSYTHGNGGNMSGDQLDAVYRSVMIDNYIPEVVVGGWSGWGPSFPVIGGQTSIDNEFLFLALTQGYLGAFTFSLMICEALIATYVTLRRVIARRDVAFVFCIGGCILGVTFCLGTVALSSPVYDMFFLLLGWSQALRPAEQPARVPAASAGQAKFQFRKVFT